MTTPDIKTIRTYTWIYSSLLVLICENATGNFSKCQNYPGIINIMNVEFKEENEDYCDNQPSRNRSKCFASERDEQKLTSILGKICDGKRKCKVHLSHGVYEGMDLPCRDLNIRIRIGIFYDCIYCKLVCVPSICKVYAFKLNQSQEDDIR